MVILGDKYNDDDEAKNISQDNKNVISLPLKNARKVFEKNYSLRPLTSKLYKNDFTLLNFYFNICQMMAFI